VRSWSIIVFWFWFWAWKTLVLCCQYFHQDYSQSCPPGFCPAIFPRRQWKHCQWRTNCNATIATWRLCIRNETTINVSLRADSICSWLFQSHVITICLYLTLHPPVGLQSSSSAATTNYVHHSSVSAVQRRHDAAAATTDSCTKCAFSIRIGLGDGNRYSIAGDFVAAV
jgi:hypothetical protein